MVVHYNQEAIARFYGVRLEICPDSIKYMANRALAICTHTNAIIRCDNELWVRKSLAQYEIPIVHELHHDAWIALAYCHLGVHQESI